MAGIIQGVMRGLFCLARSTQATSLGTSRGKLSVIRKDNRHEGAYES